MDVLLIHTPFYPLQSNWIEPLPLEKQERTSVTPPLGITYLSAYLKERGYNVRLLDLDLEIFTLLKNKGSYTFFDILPLLRKKPYDVVGISCFSSARHKQAHMLAQVCKCEGATVVMGGNYPTNSPQLALKDKNIDYLVLGEGEETFYKLLRAIEEGVGLEELDGIAYQDKIIPKTSFTKDLDTLPFPDYGGLDIERYYNLEMSQGLDSGKRFFTLFTSRGCPNPCTYCGARNIFGQRIRYRSVDNVLKEIEWLKSKYGMNEVILQDDNFTIDKKRAESILDKLKGVSWCIPNGVELNTIDRNFLEKVKSSGGTDLAVAIETGSEKTLKLIKKHVNLNRAKEVIDTMRELGIYSKAFFMIGFPGETKEDIQKTIDFASNLKADWSSFSIVNPLPGTELYREGYHFDDIGYANANITTEEFSPEYISKVVSNANMRINFLENPNIKLNPQIAIRDFRRILDRYPGHNVAREALRRLNA